MARYRINKGVGRAVEVKGLRAQYFIYAVIGVILAVIIFFVLSFIVGQTLSLLLSFVSLVFNISICFVLNNKFGENGLSQLYAQRATPDRIAFNKRVCRIIVVNNED